METSQPLATESFSYSWLTSKGKGPAFDHSLDEDTKDQETKHSMVFESKRFLEEALNFNFDVPISKSSLPTLVDADAIFSHGQIMPLYSIPSSPVSFRSDGGSSIPPGRKRFSHLLGKWRKSSKRLLHKCFEFLRPRKSIRVAADIDHRKDGGDQVLLQIRSNNVSSDFDHSSISEAVLHCKRSISMLS